MAESTFYVTTPIYYVNADPHLGHAYSTVVADTVARYRRLCGDDVYFLTGTDEHGQKVERSATKQGIAPKELADRVADRYRELWPRLRITHDQFIRTTDPLHMRGAAKLFERMKAAGDIYKDKYEGWYCTSCEGFWPESQLLEGKLCPDDKVPTEWVEEESYFFKLSKYQQPLLDLYAKDPGFVRPASRLNEVRQFVAMGLKDLSVSRTSFTWGIPVPGDEKHVIYVWIDALSNYITALGYGDEPEGEKVARYWPASLHVVGKEILRFHAAYWPAMLMSAGLPLPKCVYAHGWWTRGDLKMSKSKGNIARIEPLLDTFGADALRYFLLRDMVFGLDAPYTDEAPLARYNSDLANDLGNLASRVLTLIERQAPDGLPAPARGDLATVAERVVPAWRKAFDELAFRSGLEATSELVAESNRFLVRAEPWKTKDVQALADAAEALRLAAIMLHPVMPEATVTLLTQLGQETAVSLDALAWGRGRDGGPLKKAPALFPRIDRATYLERLERDEPSAPAPESAPASAPDSSITIDEFRKAELRTAIVRSATRVPKADRLLQLVVELDGERRTVVAGIAATYTPEELVGRTVILVANLRKAKIRGIESHGMLLAADLDGNAILAGFDREVPPGRTVR